MRPDIGQELWAKHLAIEYKERAMHRYKGRSGGRHQLESNPVQRWPEKNTLFYMAYEIANAL
jgi:hypothetical protein